MSMPPSLICPSCGAPPQDGQRFCKRCGFDVYEWHRQAASSARAPRAPRLRMALWMTLIAAAVVILAFLLLRVTGIWPV